MVVGMNELDGDVNNRENMQTGLMSVGGQIGNSAKQQNYIHSVSSSNPPKSSSWEMVQDYDEGIGVNDQEGYQTPDTNDFDFNHQYQNGDINNYQEDIQFPQGNPNFGDGDIWWSA
jgi:hypothetical protein